MRDDEQAERHREIRERALAVLRKCGTGLKLKELAKKCHISATQLASVIEKNRSYFSLTQKEYRGGFTVLPHRHLAAHWPEWKAA